MDAPNLIIRTAEFHHTSRTPYVYGHYRDDVLIYIGSGIGRRANDFKRRKYSKEGVIVKLLSTFDTREDALEAEELLIEMSKPKFNIRSKCGLPGPILNVTPEERLETSREAVRLSQAKARATTEGREAAREATRVYRATPEGREANRKASRLNHTKARATPEGREAFREAANEAARKSRLKKKKKG